jgi:uncharacterized protein YqhQ
MRKSNIGGQAIIEGVMMMGPESYAVAVRKPDGDIIVDKKPLPEKKWVNKTPVIRGVFNLFRQMVVGIKALMYSADFVDIEESNGEKEKQNKESLTDRLINKIFGDKFKDAAIYFAVIISLAFSVGLFILLPNVLAGFLNFNKNTAGGVILYNLFEGLIRVLLFLGYLILVSMMKDIKRVWQYHGAEHKTIHCYEHEDELSVENVRKFTTKHARCGTSFLFLVMIVSILVFSLLGWHSIWINILARILLIPLVAGISYEILKISAKSKLGIMKVVSAPGLFFQLFTTREPDDSQIEVAIEAFNNVLEEDGKE